MSAVAAICWRLESRLPHPGNWIGRTLRKDSGKWKSRPHCKTKPACLVPCFEALERIDACPIAGRRSNGLLNSVRSSELKSSRSL